MAKLTRIGILAHMGTSSAWSASWPLAGLAVGLLCVLFWGYRMWWQRRPTRSPRLTPLARSGTPRGLPQTVVFAIVLGSVAVGWLMPVLGVSLLIFLAGDALAGSVSRRRAARSA